MLNILNQADVRHLNRDYWKAKEAISKINGRGQTAEKCDELRQKQEFVAIVERYFGSYLYDYDPFPINE